MSAGIQDPEVLVVDDDPGVRDVLAQFLTRRSLACDAVENGKQALERLKHSRYQLVLLDVLLPDANGFELLASICDEYPAVPVMMVSGIADTQTVVHAMKRGASDYISKPIDFSDFSRKIDIALNARRQELQRKVTAEYIRGMLALDELKETRRSFLRSLLAALEARTDDTCSHSLRVQAYALRLGREFNLEPNRMRDLSYAALLHDIGKIAIPDEILSKKSNLKSDEKIKIRKHSQIGYQILNGARFLKRAAALVLVHHEWYNGSGYPLKLSGQNIPLEARILSVVDAYDAITTDRPYRWGRPMQSARRKIKAAAGKQFDPEVVERFLAVPAQEWDLIRQGVAPLSPSTGLRQVPHLA